MDVFCALFVVFVILEPVDVADCADLLVVEDMVLPLVILELSIPVLAAGTVEDAAEVEGVPEAEDAPLTDATVLELSSTKYGEKFAWLWSLSETISIL